MGLGVEIFVRDALEYIVYIFWTLNILLYHYKVDKHSFIKVLAGNKNSQWMHKQTDGQTDGQMPKGDCVFFFFLFFFVFLFFCCFLFFVVFFFFFVFFFFCFFVCFLGVGFALFFFFFFFFVFVFVCLMFFVVVFFVI